MLGAYLMFAFDRFGWPDFAVQPTARFLLAGFYGWMWLALASWMLGRAVGGSREPPAAILRLTGHAHLPLLLIAVLIQVVSVMANATNVLAVPALLMAVVWFPGLLAQAVAAASERSVGEAALIVAFIAAPELLRTIFRMKKKGDEAAHITQGWGA